MRFRIASSTISQVWPPLVSKIYLKKISTQPQIQTVQCCVHTHRNFKPTSLCPVYCPFKIKNNQTSEFDTTIAWRSDSYLAVGILGFGLYLLLGITSLPSVSNALSWREFSFIQVNVFLSQSIQVPRWVCGCQGVHILTQTHRGHRIQKRTLALHLLDVSSAASLCLRLFLYRVYGWGILPYHFGRFKKFVCCI